MIATIVIALVTGLVVNEFTDLCPWLAGKLVRWSAFYRYDDAVRAETRAEELTALIKKRPGNLLKLITAVGFAVSAVAAGARDAVDQSVSWLIWQASKRKLMRVANSLAPGERMMVQRTKYRWIIIREKAAAQAN